VPGRPPVPVGVSDSEPSQAPEAGGDVGQWFAAAGCAVSMIPTGALWFRVGKNGKAHAASIAVSAEAVI
jgi:hypothetical protein